jgi:hypothetical protein
LMAVALLIFNSFGFTNLLFLLIVGAVLYFVLVYLLGGVDKASLQEIISRGE